MNMKDSLFLLISNGLGGGVGLGRGPSNDDAGSSVSADLKCFRKGVWGWGWSPLTMKESLFLLVSLFFTKWVWGWGRAH